jgi:nucleoid-associated protein EbfC
LFKGLGNLANLGSIMKQAQQMGSTFQGINEQLKTQRVTGAAGGGLVEVEANGLGEVLAVRIDPALIARGDREMIEDLLPAAINQVGSKVKERFTEALGSMTQDLNLPGVKAVLEQLSGGNHDAT